MQKYFRHARHALVVATTFAITLVGFLGAAALDPTAAAADPGPIVQRAAGTVTADALPTVQIDGVVWDQQILGNTVYAGGEFANARPAGAAAGTNLTRRANLLAYDIRTGVLISSFAPVLNAQVKTLALSPDGTRLYAGGSFTTVNGINRYRIAAFDTATGALVSSFAPVLNSAVSAIAVTNDAVYVGGAFNKAGSVDRMRLAAFSPATGALLGWAPTANSGVNALLVSPDKSRVLAAGSFGTINGSTATGLAALDPTTAALLPFAANTVVRNYGSSAAMLSLSTDGSTVYSAGYWFGGTGNFEGVVAADANTGAVKWLADCHGDTYDAAPMNGNVYAVSHWHHCSNIGAFPDTNPRSAWYRANAMTADATGTVAHNNQGGYYDYYNQPAPSVVNWFPDMPAGTYTGQSQAGWSTTSNSQYLLIGGEFSKVNGGAQQGLVRFGVGSVAPKTQGPRVSGTPFNPTLLAVSNKAVRVNWKSNWDRDDQVLTYAVTRLDKTVPVYTTAATSQFWNRPTLSFTDDTVVAGQTYKYRVSAADPDGNKVSSDIVNVTVPTSVSPYVTSVLEDGAVDYWRMNGTGSFPDYAGSADLTATSGVTANPSGAVTGDSDGAADFNGSTGAAATTAAIDGPNTFTAEAWFKTTSAAGGKILGFGNASTGTSSSYDRHVYLDNAGRLAFGVYNDNVSTIRSASAYNDGQWHQVAAQLSPAGMVLYVDGLKVGALPAVTSGQVYSGFWRVGGDNLNGWPDQPSSTSLNGTIDEVAIYPTALTVAQVRDHYTASGRTVDTPAAPSDAYGKAVFDDGPSSFWRLNETSGTTAADSSADKAPGIYSGDVTYGTASNVAGTTGTAVTFNGTNGTVAATVAIPGPSTYSEEVWFKTTTTRGGKLIGFGDAQQGTSSNYDRHVYMESSGQLTFGVYTGQVNTATSPQSYNDGQWHQAVATQSSAGMRLYVDGALVGTNAQTQAQGYSGYWRVGGDSSWAGDNFFNGALDEAAFYPTALTAEQVGAHYAASPAATAPPAPVNAAPAASFTSSCSGAACGFDASGSSDSDGTVASYAWAFGDDSAGTGATPDHTYAASGTYPVTLTVTDDKGATATVTRDVTVTVPAVNQLPVAAFTSNCTELVCAFDGTGSTDPDGSVATYAWDFGDGETTAASRPSHTFTAGTYAVKLTVTDDRGGKDSVTRNVTVKSNAKPVAAFTSDCTTLTCAFDAAASTDDDGTVAGYAWDFGDDSAAGSGRTAEHTYASAGTYSVRLTVTDDKGATDSTTRSVTVAAAANQPPKAGFTSSASGLVASFDGSTSSDPDGTIASYAWTFGDGSTGTGRTATRTYTGTGTYAVKLVVTDGDGATDTVTKKVVVAPGVLARDAFDRTVAKWGTADSGGAWTLAGSTFSTNGSTGNVRLATPGTAASGYLNAVSQQNVNLVADVSIDTMATGGGTATTLITRKVGTSDYRMTFKQMPGGAIRLNLSRVLNGTSTSLRDVNVSGVTYGAGDAIRVRFVVNGSGTTTLSGKVWRVGTAEPTSAQITATDSSASLQARGAVGIYAYLSGSSTTAPVTISLDNLLLTDR